MVRGTLAGFPVVDLKVRLVDGKYHSVDSSDMAFQTAGLRGFRAAFEAAGPVLLEPIVKIQVTVPSAMMGDAIGDLSSRRGRVFGTDTVEEKTIITATVPLAETLDFEPKLMSMTRGTGTFTLTLDHYEICPPMVQEMVVKESGFQVAKDED
jgi:elongation factor G